MNLQQIIDEEFTHHEITSLILPYARNGNEAAQKVLFELPSNVVRREFYVNVSAGMILSTRRHYTTGQDFDGPLYGYALTLGARPEQLETLIDEIRLESWTYLCDYLSNHLDYDVILR